jgi:2-polyprenyl-3-methyl-5-hydroxy-6-metoxy-1,4-benzoquinol methylase
MTPPQPLMTEQAWPADGLERVPDCPICGSSARSLLHEGLSDQIFFAAPGAWDLWQCARCRSAWLDPRPDEATIGIAYGSYYTHADTQRPQPQNAFERLRAALGNGYRNSRYGTHLSPASPLGRPLAALLPPLRWPVDTAYRFMPRRLPGKTMHVLDVGCGNGAWLEMARDAGWEVGGVEPDPVSREQAGTRGFEVREGIADWLTEPGTFDYVTMSHVIEHVHDPLALLRDSLTLLRPGGGLFVDTPNIDAFGHQLYGRHWRGLEPPRHLILFNRASLSKAVSSAGFRNIRYPFRLYPMHGLSEQSRRIAAGLDPYSSETSSDMPPPLRRARRLRAALDLQHSEFLALTAIKPR